MGLEDAAASLAHASTPAIIGTGLLLGIVHVLTGPDHLSALIVLSAGSSWRSCQLGMRWGCGHSTGLIVVTAAFLAVNQHLDIDRFGSYCDFMVGFLMMGLGLWGLRHYLLLRNKLKTKHHHHHHEAATEETPLTLETGLNSSSSSSDDDEEVRKILHDHGADHDDAAVPRTSCCFGLCAADIKNPQTQRLTAFLYGTAHGLAGTGGILGVLPAVILNDWAKSSAYLGSFCIASILVMGAFAAVYGEVTGRMSRFSDASLVRVGVFSSSVSLCVGVLWVVLVSTGTLDEVFG